MLTSSTHKTFAGPQGGLLLANDAALYERIAPAIYPALVTNHHLHRLPALWAVCEEWRSFGQAHARAIVANARALGAAMDAVGLPMVGKERVYTDTHTLLIRQSDAKAAAARLESAGILVTPVGLPPALGGTCLRLGVQEITRNGMTEADAPRLAALIAHGLATTPETAADIASEAATLARGWDTCRFTWSNH